MSGSSAPRAPVISRRAAVATFTTAALIGIAADVVTKILAIQYLAPADPKPLLGWVLQLYLIRNPGAAFSIGAGFTPVFTVLAFLVLVGLLWFVVPKVRHRGWAIGLGLVVAGITGNLIDRLFRPPGFGRGHVVDMLMLPRWPIFNLADVCVVSGAILIMLIWVVRGIAMDGTPEPGRDDKSGKTDKTDRTEEPSAAGADPEPGDPVR
ncbi:signal peptidase II [Propionibacteriaceae bacterium ES.041]|nr:signal peptidase II [Propionibacteriaceae bacterium ES.041]